MNKEKEGVTNIVMISRQVYRKGVDLSKNLIFYTILNYLALKIIPIICEKYPHVNFIIGGSGNGIPKLVDMIGKMGIKLYNKLHHLSQFR